MVLLFSDEILWIQTQFLSIIKMQNTISGICYHLFLSADKIFSLLGKIIIIIIITMSSIPHNGQIKYCWHPYEWNLSLKRTTKEMLEMCQGGSNQEIISDLVKNSSSSTKLKMRNLHSRIEFELNLPLE